MLGWGLLPSLPCSQRNPGQALGWGRLGALLLPELRAPGCTAGPCSVPSLCQALPDPSPSPAEPPPVPDRLKVCRPQLQGIFTSQHRGWE